MKPTTAPADHSDALLTFTENPQDGPPISKFSGMYVLLRREHSNTPDVRPGEAWLCDLWKRPTCFVAEPKERVSPTPTDAGDHEPAAPEDAPAAPPAAAADEHAGQAGKSREIAPRGEEPEPLVRLRPDAEGNLHAAGNVLEALSDFLGDERLLLMVHAPQVEAATKDLGAGVDWGILPELLNGAATLTAAIYHDADAGDAERGALHDMLSRLGYVIRPKALRATSQSARAEALEMLDTEFIIDTLESAFRTDLVFLAVNDVRFLPLVRTLQRRGKRVYIISSRNVLSPALSLAANKPIVYLEDINAVLREADELPRGRKP